MTCSRTGRRPPAKLRVTLDSLAFGGDAVGRAPDGRVVFVPGGAPGDEVEAIVEEEKKGYVRASLGRLLAPSAQRVEPPCPLFREADCGGCQWQHVADGAQRAAKEEIVRRALRHAGVTVAPIVTPAPPYHWRRRARMRWRRLAERAILGYAERRSHRLVDVAACPQLEPALEGALLAIRAALLPHLTGAGDLHLLLGARGVHVVLDGVGVRDLAARAGALIGEAGIRGILLRDRGGETALGERELALDEGDFLLSADLFAQASAAGNDALRAALRAAAGPLAGARVLELHAGSGNFTRDLLAAGATVVAVEDHPGAVALARRNLAGRAVTLRAEPAAAAVAALSGERFDLIVVDPPRTGLEPGLPAALAALGAPRIVYISCDPNTLARDLAAFPGYRATAATPFDLMPQTFHIEVVTTLQSTGTCSAET